MVTPIPLYLKERVKQMMKLQNIANSIIYEQSLVSNVLGINDLNTNPGWLIRVPQDITYLNGKKTLKTSENPTRLKGWEVTEFAKDFNKNGGFNETIDTRNTDDAIKFINGFEAFRIYPDVYNKKVLLRDKDKSVYLVNYPEKSIRTHWTDVPWANSMGKDKIWKASKYIGDGNSNWFDTNFKLSKKSKQTQKPKVTKNDQLTAKLVVAAAGGLIPGTNEKWLKQALGSITSIAQFNKINNSLKDVVQKQGDTLYWTDEILFISRGEVKLKPFTQAEKDLGSDLAWDIWGTVSGTGNKNKMVIHAALPDYVIGKLSSDVETQGIAGLITSEMDKGEDRDKVLTILIENEICQWEQTTNSCVFPDGIKVNFQYDPSDEIRYGDKYHYYGSEEEAPEEEAPEEE